MQLVLPDGHIARLATGLVVAVRGSASAVGTFRVEAWCLPRLPSPSPLPTGAAGEPGQFIAFVSGLAFRGLDDDAEENNLAEARTRIADFLMGKCEDSNAALLGRAVKRLVVCGDLIKDDVPSGSVLAAVNGADEFLSRLASAVPVHVMPGRSDPTNLTLPQMALHPYLFRKT